MDSVITSQTISAVTEAMRPVAEALGEAGKWSFEQALRMNFAYAITDLVYVFIVLAVSGWFFKKCVPSLSKSMNAASSTEEGMYLFTIIIGSLVVIGFLAGAFFGWLPHAIYRLSAPEWMTIKDIIAVVNTTTL